MTSEIVTSQPINMPKPATWLGKNKHQVLQDLLRLNYGFEEFVGWLMIPTLGVVLSFKRQICVKIGTDLLSY